MYKFTHKQYMKEIDRLIKLYRKEEKRYSQDSQMLLAIQHERSEKQADITARYYSEENKYAPKDKVLQERVLEQQRQMKQLTSLKEH